MSCLFCKIVAGEIPSTAVFQDDLGYAFADINPKAPVHVLIVPREHIGSLAEAGNEKKAPARPPAVGGGGDRPQERPCATATALW